MKGLGDVLGTPFSDCVTYSSSFNSFHRQRLPGGFLNDLPFLRRLDDLPDGFVRDKAIQLRGQPAEKDGED